METPFPQFAMSSDPAVVAAVRLNGRRYAAFLDAASSLALRYAGRPDAAVIEGHAHRGATISALLVHGAFAAALPGRWRKAGPLEGSLTPQLDNPVREEFDAAAFTPGLIPGRPEYARGRQTALRYGGTGMLFIVDGCAYSGFGFPPQHLVGDPGSTHPWEPVSRNDWEVARARHAELLGLVQGVPA